MSFLRAKNNRPMYCLSCFEGRRLLRILNPSLPFEDTDKEEDDDYPYTYWCHVCNKYSLGMPHELITHALKDFEDSGIYHERHNWEKVEGLEDEEGLFQSMPRIGAVN